VILKTGAQFILTSREIIGNDKEVSTNFKEIPKLVQKGAAILLDDGAIELQVKSVSKTDVVTIVKNGRCSR